MKKFLLLGLTVAGALTLTGCSSNEPKTIDDVLEFLQAESETSIYDNYKMSMSFDMMGMSMDTSVEFDGDTSLSTSKLDGEVFELSYTVSATDKVTTYSIDADGKWEKTEIELDTEADTETDTEADEVKILTADDFTEVDGVYTCTYEGDDSEFSVGDVIDMSKEGQFTLSCTVVEYGMEVDLVCVFSNFGEVELTLPTVGEVALPSDSEEDDTEADSAE